MMHAVFTALLAICTACGPVHHPESIRTIAAFEVPLPTVVERHQFIEVLRREAAAAGLHVDAVSDEDLHILSQISPLTMNAAIWRGDDEEMVASAINPPTRPEKVWITFAQGERPGQFTAFRHGLMRKIIQHWPETLPLPIMPTGAIPNPHDMDRTPSGYVVKPSERWRYEFPKEPPAAQSESSPAPPVLRP